MICNLHEVLYRVSREVLYEVLEGKVQNNHEDLDLITLLTGTDINSQKEFAETYIVIFLCCVLWTQDFSSSQYF